MAANTCFVALIFFVSPNFTNMTYRLSLLLIFCLLSFVRLSAQICDQHPFFMEGKTIGYTHYNSSGKPESKSKQVVKTVKKTGTNKVAEIDAEILNQKDKVEHQMKFNVSCSGNVLSMDFKNFIPSQTLEAYKNMEMTMEGVNLDYPDNLKAGQSLPDGKVKLKVKSSGMEMMDMEIDIVNRKVEATETLETPAGSFECAVISQESKMATSAMGIPMKMNFTSKEWFSPKAGMVKSENYNEKGKLKGYTILTDLK